MKNTQENYQAFIFDMDGTILSTIEDIGDAVNYSLAKHGLPLHTYEEYKTFVGNGSVLLIKRAIGKEHQDLFQSVFDVYYDYYKIHFKDKTKPYDGLIDALKYAKSKGILLFIYTNKPEKIAIECEESSFGKGFFEKMVGIPLGGVTKPDPKAFFEATKEYHLDYQSVAYFGDSTTDIETAHNLGTPNMYSVLWGYQSYQKLSTYPLQPKAFLKEPKEIKLVVDGIL